MPEPGSPLEFIITEYMALVDRKESAQAVLGCVQDSARRTAYRRYLKALLPFMEMKEQEEEKAQREILERFVDLGPMVIMRK